VRARVAVQVLLAVSALAVGAHYYAARQFTMTVSWVKGAAHAVGAKVHGWVRVILPVSVA
jgi:hypothetical protein